MEKLIVVKTKEDLRELIEYLRDQDYIAYDTETNGLDKESKIIGFSVCSNINISYYVVISYWDTNERKLVDLFTAAEVYPVIEILSKKNLIMHNAVFDCWMTKNNFGVDLMSTVHTDTMILGHVLNENRSNGLKERGVELYGEDARDEQKAMKESVTKNGGQLTKKIYELYKADADLLAYYGAKDAQLTLKLFYHDVPLLFEAALDTFFYEEESMPLLRRTTYDLNTVGLRVDPEKLQNLKATLEAECIEAKAYILKETAPYTDEKYPGTKKTNHFNIGSTSQLAWLLFIKLENEFNILTDAGKEVCKALEMPIPYSRNAKECFIQACIDQKGFVYKEGYFNKKTKKNVRPKKIGDPWSYLTCGKDSLNMLSKKYKWVARLLEYKKNLKLLNTYVEGIESRMVYNVIRPSFLQHGTTSGRYSSKNPNFQNLPREDKRIKSCIVSRPGKVFVGADYSQLEPRVFASFSGDTRLQGCFSRSEDFYSVIGVEVFNKNDCTVSKNGKKSFANLYPEERQLSKTFALAATYGATPFRLAKTTGKPTKETEEMLNNYFESFPSVYQMMTDSYAEVQKEGQVKNLFGRPRRMPKAKEIKDICGDTAPDKLPYEYRNILNLAVNHRIQSTAASIVNRASIAFYNRIRADGISNCNIAMQVHDEIIVECKQEDANKVAEILKYVMENTVQLPGVKLIAEPKIANNLADLK